ncbi:hypothetical protein QUA81_01295 [Microcoleus sp. F6_B4]
MRCSWALGIGHWALGIGHWALARAGHWAWGIGHGALAKQEEYLTFLRTAIVFLAIALSVISIPAVRPE